MPWVLFQTALTRGTFCAVHEGLGSVVSVLYRCSWPNFGGVRRELNSTLNWAASCIESC